MTVAELFVKIGVAGAEGVGRSLSGVQKGMSGLLDSSLAMKAAIAGVVIGLERITGFASQVGMELNKFNMTTGLSTEKLQEWQKVGNTYDVTAQEMTNTISGLQSTISDMMLGKGMPEGAAALGIKMTRDPYNMMHQLVDKAKSLPPDVGRNLIKSFGISDNVFQMMRSMDFEKDKISKKDIISDDEIRNLVEVNKLWKEFWFNLKTMAIKTVAKDGVFAVNELTGAFRLLVDVKDWIVALGDRFKWLVPLIALVGVALGLAFAPITTIIGGIILALGEIQKFRENKDMLGGLVSSEQVKGTKDYFSDPNAPSGIKFINKLFGGTDRGESSTPNNTASGSSVTPAIVKKSPQEMAQQSNLPNNNDALLNQMSMLSKLPSASESVIPQVPSQPQAPAGSGTINMNNVFNIDGSQSPQETGNEIKKQLSNAAFQSKVLSGSK